MSICKENVAPQRLEATILLTPKELRGLDVSDGGSAVERVGIETHSGILVEGLL